MKAQGSTEYLVLLGVALIVALTVIGILAYYPGTSNDAKRTQSDLYWRRAYPISVLEATGHGEIEILRLKNIGSERVIIRGINASGSTAAGIGYSDALQVYHPTPAGTELRTTGSDTCNAMNNDLCNAATHSILNCSISLPPGKEIWVQYHLYGGVQGEWTGQPADACGMIDTGNGKYAYLNSPKSFVEASPTIYYSTSASGVVQIETGPVTVYVPCADYGVRTSGEGNSCKGRYDCGLGGQISGDGLCVDYVY
ncbi:MAG: hypothetical protein NTV88_05880 [Candidatus Micrarchaeota archaeon]|nr:hypothetical protein [Candidatus Micrarchaeota archaeon]